MEGLCEANESTSPFNLLFFTTHQPAGYPFILNLDALFVENQTSFYSHLIAETADLFHRRQFHAINGMFLMCIGLEGDIVFWMAASREAAGRKSLDQGLPAILF